MQQGTLNDIDSLGKKLSMVINCPVRFHMDAFVCKHGLVFKVTALRALEDISWTKDWHERSLK